MSKNLYSTKDLNRTLTFKDLMGASIGQIIGAGIMSLTGVAIGMTGRSVPIAFILSAVFVLVSWYPMTLMSTVARFRGGAYTIIGSFLSEKLTGVYTIIYALTNITLSMYCLSFADYAMPFVPYIPRKLLAIGILTIIYALNMLGIDKFSKFQNVIVGTLVAALTVFSVFGITKIAPNYYTPATFMTGGVLGLLRATAQLTFATGGAAVIANLSAEAVNPTKDIPRVMIYSTVGVAVLYGFMSLIAAGVHPVEQVANQPLTKVARSILPDALYYFFMIGGAWFALISTLNSQLASVTKPIMQACEDGWLPHKFSKVHNKYRTPVYILTFFFIVGLVPILFNLDISIISRITTTLGGVINSMIALSLLGLIKHEHEAWEKSPLHISDGLAKTLVFVAVGIFVFQSVLLGTSLSMPLLIGNLVVVVSAFVYSELMYRTGKVNVEPSYEIE